MANHMAGQVGRFLATREFGLGIKLKYLLNEINEGRIIIIIIVCAPLSHYLPIYVAIIFIHG